MKKKQSVSNPDEAQIAAWKSEYGKIYCLEVAVEPISVDPHLLVKDLEDQPVAKGYIHAPDNKVLNYATRLLPNIQEAGKVIVKNCWLGGNEDILNTDALLNSVAMQVIELIKIHQTRLKEV